MKRWQADLSVMQRRLRFERIVHSWSGQPYEECHCYEKRGLFRKHRPLDTSLRFFRRIRQHEAHKRIKALREQRLAARLLARRLPVSRCLENLMELR